MNVIRMVCPINVELNRNLSGNTEQRRNCIFFVLQVSSDQSKESYKTGLMKHGEQRNYHFFAGQCPINAITIVDDDDHNYLKVHCGYSARMDITISCF